MTTATSPGTDAFALRRHRLMESVGERGAALFFGAAELIRSNDSTFDFRQNSDLWYLTIDLPENSRVEYKLEIVTGQDHRLIEDPLNPRKSFDPFGSNSVCLGQGYVEPDWVRVDPAARTIEILRRAS